MTRERLVDDALDVVIYECEKCAGQVGSPMPFGAKCIRCRRPMVLRYTRASGSDGDLVWREYRGAVAEPARETLF